MKILEIILGSLAIISLILNFMGIPATGMVLLVSMSALSMMYLYLGFVIFNETDLRTALDNTKKDVVIASHYKLKGIVTGVIFSFSLLSILFKTMIWPISEIQMILALIILSAWGLYYLYTYYHSNDAFYLFTLKRWFILFPILLFFLSVSKNDLFKKKFKAYPTLVEAYIQANNNPENEALQEILDTEWKKYNEMKLAKPNELAPTE